LSVGLTLSDTLSAGLFEIPNPREGCYTFSGCHILNGPFEIPIGQGAMIADTFGTRRCILDMAEAHGSPIWINMTVML